MTPEVQGAHAAWLTTYGAVKLVTEGVLKLHGKSHLMPSIFDDLAEVHHAKGVHDDPAQAAGSGGGAQSGAGTAASSGGAAQS